MKKTLVVLVGLPRSGTTMATAMFDVHPDIVAWFEPWNVSKDHSLQPLEGLSDFENIYKEKFNIDIKDKNILMIKETSAHEGAITWVDESLQKILETDDVKVKIIWLIRDINHAYLSRVHTAREHWGHPDMKIDTESFKFFVNFAYKGFESIQKLTKKHDSCMLSYEKLVAEPKKTLIDAMNFIGTELHSNQLEYHVHFKKNKSAGDPGVTKNPKPITTNKIEEKDIEWNKYQDILLNSLDKDQTKKYNEMMEVVRKIKEKNFISNITYWSA